jgi:hypothetical protein
MARLSVFHFRCRPRRLVLATVVDLLLIRKPLLCMLIQEGSVRQHDLRILRVSCELQPLIFKLNLSECVGLLKFPFDRRLLVLHLDLLPLNFQLFLHPLPVPLHYLLLRIQHKLVPLLFLVLPCRKDARPCGR